MVDCIVIGAGIVGTTCALELQKRGRSVLVLDDQPPGSMASSGNAGGIAVTEVMPIGSPGMIWRVPGWLFDRYGPLSLQWSHLPAMLPWLWRLQRQSSHPNMRRNAQALSCMLSLCLEDTRQLLHRSNLSDCLTEYGALTVYPSQASLNRDRLEWQVKRDHGVEATLLDKLEIHDLEPNLHNIHSGWFTPTWSNVSNPYTLTVKLADHFLQDGGAITRERVTGFELDNGHIKTVLTNTGKRHQADRFIIAAGVWSKSLCRSLGDRVLLEAERGYNTMLPEPGLEIGRQIVFGKEKFVASKIDSKIRIGGTAEFAPVDAPADPNKADRLLEIAKRYLPDLNTAGRENWMGQRPSTPDSLPVIGDSSKVDNVLYAFGHGHLGLTMAATTARLIGKLAHNEAPGIDMQPFHIDRFK